MGGRLNRVFTVQVGPWLGITGQTFLKGRIFFSLPLTTYEYLCSVIRYQGSTFFNSLDIKKKQERKKKKMKIELLSKHENRS